MEAPLAARRLAAQQIARHALATPGELVAWMGAIQAQDYGAAKWAVGLRLGGGSVTEERIERAIAEGAILRTHALRGTWQLIAPADVRWMLALVAPRLITRYATRYRELKLDAAAFRRSRAALARALRGGEHLTRGELAAALREAGLSPAGQRLAYLLQRAELEGLICGGARRGKQPTYALLDQHAPGPAPKLGREEALAELARRYFRSRGPATADDFGWWSGLSPAEARAGLESVKPELVSGEMEGRTHWRAGGAPAAGAGKAAAYLLPAFDEYLVAYRDRDAVLDPEHVKRINAGGGMLNPCVVIGGQVVGLWSRTLARAAVRIDVRTFETLSPAGHRAIEAAARRYGAFLGLEASLGAITRARGSGGAAGPTGSGPSRPAP